MIHKEKRILPADFISTYIELVPLDERNIDDKDFLEEIFKILAEL
jgi:hypothetical protein